MSDNIGSTTAQALLQLKFSTGGHPLTRIFSQRWGAVLALLAMHIGLTPNQVSLLAALCSVAGAAVFVFPGDSAAPILACMLLTQLGYAFDCADGQLARVQKRASTLGQWLDVYLDMLTIISLAFACLYRIIDLQPALLPYASLASLIYCFSRVGDLLTCTLIRTGNNTKTRQRLSLPHKLFLISIDTPVVLLCIALLRNSPELLIGYLNFCAALFIIHGLYIGVRRLGGGPDQTL